MPDLTLERQHGGIVAGVDEVGRGPWAGPVVAAAVILPAQGIPNGINDSKKLSAKKREALYHILIEIADVSVAMASVEEIDQLNILAATKLAMQRAVAGLRQLPQLVLIDGNQSVVMPCQVQTVVKGDSISLSIAAASIVAKVTRDALMSELAKHHPYYGWESNAGYGTKIHQDGLVAYGITEHHRKSFKPIAAFA